MDCVFCSIINGEIPSKKVYEDDKVLAFYDIAPQAPVHIIVVPKEHIPSMSAIDSSNSQVVAHIFEVIAHLAKVQKLSGGYRVISNCGKDACQSVEHLHFHVLAGKNLGERLA